jgi:hypothetical protein
MKLTDITPEHAEVVARIAKIKGVVTVEIEGSGDFTEIHIRGTGMNNGERIMTLYDWADIRIYDNGFMVMNYCYIIYHTLHELGYRP